MAKKSKNIRQPTPKLSRKALRKLKREEKKHKHRSIKGDIAKVSVEHVSVTKKTPKLQETKNTQEAELKKESLKLRRLQKQMNAQRVKQLIEDNRREDKLIKSLEKKLKLRVRKKKTLPQSFVMEGLDYLLEICDLENHKGALNLEKELNETSVLSDASDDFDKNTNDFDVFDSNDEDEPIVKKRKKNFKFLPIEENQFVDSHEFEDNDGDFEDYSANESESDDDCCDLVPSEKYTTNKKEEKDSNSNNIDESIKTENLREDIYGRLRNDEGKVVQSKYVPPQLRETKSNELSGQKSEKLLKLKRQMKSLLNRLTGTNVHSIAVQLEEMYMANSRNDVNSTLTQLMKESLILSTVCPLRMVIEHAFLISVLHANVGSEVGAFILQTLVEEFEKLITEGNVRIEDKRLDNTVALLIQFYNFKIFNAGLIYEIMEKLVEKFEEKQIELIILILKNVGFNLRKDEAVKLKEFIFRVQQKANEKTSQSTENGRVKFMLDTLLAIKNNNRMKVLQSEVEYADQLKKLYKTVIHSGKYVTEMKITMDDLLNADTKGRWWIVGSAWSGDLKNRPADRDNVVANDSKTMYDRKILNLAKKQRMNTDTRKNIFCIIMTAEDYLDAFEKLTKLRLKGPQCREIVYVAMHCLLQEKEYNPYYSFIIEQFSTLNRKYQIAVQFCSWDRFKELDSLNEGQISNLAKCLAYLIVNKKLSLSVLKILQFTEMNKKMVKLIRELLMIILVIDDESLIMEIFVRISKSEQLFLLREGLQLFLHHFILKNIFEKEAKEYVGEKNFHLLPKRIEMAENIMRGTTSHF